MRTIELPVTEEWTPVYQHHLIRAVGASHYAETRVVMLCTLEKESL